MIRKGAKLKAKRYKHKAYQANLSILMTNVRTNLKIVPQNIEMDHENSNNWGQNARDEEQKEIQYTIKFNSSYPSLNGFNHGRDNCCY